MKKLTVNTSILKAFLVYSICFTPAWNFCTVLYIRDSLIIKEN